jgi:hypothetical protein
MKSLVNSSELTNLTFGPARLAAAAAALTGEPLMPLRIAG